MTSVRPLILLVSLRGGVSRTLATALSVAGYETVVAGDFTRAKSALDKRPDLLIADLKLGAYNGLHLAIRAGSQGTPAIVIGDPDSVLETDAVRQGARYLTLPIDAQRVCLVVAELLTASRQTRRSPRKHVRPLDVLADDLQARLLDVSYDGMRFEATGARSAPLPTHFIVRLLQFNFACPVQRVWTAQGAGDDDAPALRCGAAVTLADDETACAWRALVDSMPGLAIA